MNEKKSKIRTEDLIATIKENIKAKQASGEYKSQPPVFPEVLPFSIMHLNNEHPGERYGNLYRQAELPLEGNPIQSHRKFLGWIIVALKKYSRFWTRKYTDGLFAQQTNYNYKVADILADLERRIEHLEERLEAFEKKDSRAKGEK